MLGKALEAVRLQWPSLKRSARNAFLEMLSPTGLELELICGRERRGTAGEIPSNARDFTSKRSDQNNGRPEWIRIIDLFRVNLTRFRKITTFSVSGILPTRLVPVGQVEITARKCRLT